MKSKQLYLLLYLRNMKIWDFIRSPSSFFFNINSNKLSLNNLKSSLGLCIEFCNDWLNWAWLITKKSTFPYMSHSKLQKNHKKSPVPTCGLLKSLTGTFCRCYMSSVPLCVERVCDDMECVSVNPAVCTTVFILPNLQSNFTKMVNHILDIIKMFCDFFLNFITKH